MKPQLSCLRLCWDAWHQDTPHPIEKLQIIPTCSEFNEWRSRIVLHHGTLERSTTLLDLRANTRTMKYAHRAFSIEDYSSVGGHNSMTMKKIGSSLQTSLSRGSNHRDFRRHKSSTLNPTREGTHGRSVDSSEGRVQQLVNVKRCRTNTRRSTRVGWTHRLAPVRRQLTCIRQDTSMSKS